jgi:hypothetical protein
MLGVDVADGGDLDLRIRLKLTHVMAATVAGPDDAQIDFVVGSEDARIGRRGERDGSSSGIAEELATASIVRRHVGIIPLLRLKHSSRGNLYPIGGFADMLRSHGLRVVAVALCVTLAIPAGAFAENPTDKPPAVEVASTDQSEISSARLLDEKELADLAARAEDPDKEIIGGALSNEHLTYIVIALAAAVIVLVAK